MMLRIVLLLSIVASLACSKQDQSQQVAPQQQGTTVAASTEGFLGLPWGTDTTVVNMRFNLQLFTQMGDIRIMQANVSQYNGTPIRSATLAFRNGRFIGAGFEVPTDDATKQLMMQFNQTYGEGIMESSSFGTAGVPNTPDSVGAYTNYRWESEETTVTLMRVHGGPGYVFVMKKGESLPQMG